MYMILIPHLPSFRSWYPIFRYVRKCCFVSFVIPVGPEVEIQQHFLSCLFVYFTTWVFILDYENNIHGRTSLLES